LLFAAMCLIWGMPYLLIKLAVEDLSPAMLVLSRAALAALVLLPIAAYRLELRPLPPYWLPLLAFAALEIAGPFFLLGSAEQHVSSSLTALLLAAVPLVGAVIALTAGKRESPSLQNAIGLLVGVLGVAAIVGVSVEGARVTPLIEVGLVAICYAVGPVIVARWLADLPPLGVIGAALGLTALAYAPIVAVSGAGERPSATAVGSVVALAVVCTALAFLIFFALIAEIGPMRATVITYVNPAVAAVLGVAILDEDFTVAMGAGLVLVLGGSVLATRRRLVPAPVPA
jgi:drug/metabolite transporter (DMT)-like permease